MSDAVWIGACLAIGLLAGYCVREIAQQRRIALSPMAIVGVALAAGAVAFLLAVVVR